ncbi:SDR family NAD(P)-dependent oxidoreductase [Pseudonocardia pini]|uniref:SDR family NAD(P)-dependent oxidoreductase n=1 Tax=Pseudonocardia pini TaxID=2758030 RepID=UPI0015F087FB|nr:SDR family oxidoreductase [Pseudonocardia pini]
MAPPVPRRAALVTGGSSGIGRAFALALAEDGYDLTLVARTAEKLAVVAREVEARGGTANVVVGDVSDEGSVAASVASHVDRFGRLDVLVNSAGLGIGEPVGAVTTRRLDRQLSVNVRATVLFCREALGLLTAAGAEHGRALVLNLSSSAGRRGVGGFSVYSATKFAVVGFTEALDAELAGTGVKATVLCPSLVRTPMSEGVHAADGVALLETDDLVKVLRLLLDLSPGCQVPELRMSPPGGGS